MTVVCNGGAGGVGGIMKRDILAVVLCASRSNDVRLWLAAGTTTIAADFWCNLRVNNIGYLSFVLWVGIARRQYKPLKTLLGI